MDKSPQLSEAYGKMVDCFATYQTAFAHFQQQPDDLARFRIVEEASFDLFTALTELNRRIFDRHYKVLMQGMVSRESGTQPQE